MHHTSLFLDSRPSWVALRERAIDYARANMEVPREGWRPQLTCIPNLGRIW